MYQVLFFVNFSQVLYWSYCCATTFQCFSKCRSEIPIEVCINQWIQSAVKVAYPKDYGDYNITAFAGVTERRDDVPIEHKEKTNII